MCELTNAFSTYMCLPIGLAPDNNWFEGETYALMGAEFNWTGMECKILYDELKYLARP